MAGQPVHASVGVLGSGLIAKALLAQLARQTDYLAERLGVSLAVTAVSNSRRQLLSTEPLQGTNWQAALAASGDAADADALARHTASVPGAACCILVDATASDELPARYAAWVSQLGLHVITPNKKLGAGPLEQYLELRRTTRAARRSFLAEASVGAGLPVLSTLRLLLESGDRVLRIEGVLSGTLSFIFNTWRPGKPFSEVVKAAKAAGYTEPDPREDLSGLDVARKVVILAREVGLQLELSDLQVDSLVPPELAALPSAADYLARVHEFDGEMEAQAAEAAAQGQVLRYVGVVDVAGCSASVTTRRFPASHPLAQLQGADNLVSFVSERYPAETPLVVRGPGAGAEVTAAGVFGDLLQILRTTGAALG